MRNILAGILVLISVFILGTMAVAADQPAIADKYQVSFPEPVRVADTLLPRGNYEIRHVMEGSDHIMVFHELGTKKVVEVRAKCTLVPLDAKATDNQRIYSLNAANERVLHELIFKGDRSKHVF